MALVVNELLCYMLAKIDSVPTDVLTRLVDENFSDNEVDAAKNLLREYVDDSIRAGAKRGQHKKKHDLEDIVKMLILCDRSLLPKFVALELSKLPPISIDCIDVSSLMRKQQLQEIEIAHLKDLVQEILSVTAQTSKRLEVGLLAHHGSAATSTSSTSGGSGEPALSSDSCDTSSVVTAEPVTAGSSEPSYSEVVRDAASSNTSGWSIANRNKRGKAPAPKKSASATVRVSSFGSERPQQVRSTVRKTVIGSGKTDTIKAVTAVKRLSVFMSRLPPGTGEDAVRAYVKKQTGAEDVTATKLKSKYDSYESYRLDILNPSSADILNPELWAQGLVVRRFFVKQRSENRPHSETEQAVSAADLPADGVGQPITRPEERK